jgi:LuxR family maltose regulon positive regulatory protein
MGAFEEQEANRPAPIAAVRPAAEHSGLLLESKLHGAAVRPEWVPRERLLTALTASEAKLVLVEAPAGFGKTIMVAQWRSAASAARPFAWVFLDRGDNDPVRLWWHVVAALERACPGLAGANLMQFLAAQDADIGGQLLPRLVNALADLAQPVTLVLDDYHVLTEPRCREQIQFLLLNLAVPAQMIIITRADPPLPLARLRATGDLAEIGASELRFTPGETAALVDRVAGVRLGERDLAGLMSSTEGWPAGVSLAALSLRGHADPSARIRHLSGNNKYIADYLFEEVISGQPDQVRRFLTETSILDRFTAPLCEAVTKPAAGRPRSSTCSSARTSSSSPSARRGSGSATTTCSGRCSGASSSGLSRGTCPPCTAAPAGGTPRTDSLMRRSATPCSGTTRPRRPA